MVIYQRPLKGAYWFLNSWIYKGRLLDTPYRTWFHNQGHTPRIDQLTINLGSCGTILPHSACLKSLRPFSVKKQASIKAGLSPAEGTRMVISSNHWTSIKTFENKIIFHQKPLTITQLPVIWRNQRQQAYAAYLWRVWYPIARTSLLIANPLTLPMKSSSSYVDKVSGFITAAWSMQRWSILRNHIKTLLSNIGFVSDSAFNTVSTQHRMTKKLVDFRPDLPQQNLLINGLRGQALDFRQGSRISHQGSYHWK